MKTDTRHFKLTICIGLFYSRRFNNDTESSNDRGIVMELTYLIFVRKQILYLYESTHMLQLLNIIMQYKKGSTIIGVNMMF